MLCNTSEVDSLVTNHGLWNKDLFIGMYIQQIHEVWKPHSWNNTLIFSPGNNHILIHCQLQMLWNMTLPVPRVFQTDQSTGKLNNRLQILPTYSWQTETPQRQLSVLWPKRGMCDSYNLCAWLKVSKTAFQGNTPTVSWYCFDLLTIKQ